MDRNVDETERRATDIVVTRPRFVMCSQDAHLAALSNSACLNWGAGS
jgi:hypothetical protein